MAQAAPAAVEPVDVTIDGHAGKKLELTIPGDVEPRHVRRRRLRPVVAGDGRDGLRPVTFGDGQHDTVYIVDVDGARWVIDANYLPGTSAADLAELDQLVASIRFEP